MENNPYRRAGRLPKRAMNTMKESRRIANAIFFNAFMAAAEKTRRRLYRFTRYSNAEQHSTPGNTDPHDEWRYHRADEVEVLVRGGLRRTDTS